MLGASASVEMMDKVSQTIWKREADRLNNARGTPRNMPDELRKPETGLENRGRRKAWGALPPSGATMTKQNVSKNLTV